MKILIFQSIILMLPVIVANSSPVLLSKGGIGALWNVPIWEAGLGKNKTWRGLAAGIFFGMWTAYLLLVLEESGWLSRTYLLFDYAEKGAALTLLLGAVQGFATLAADSLKSYFKRKFNRPPGSPWPPFDELDFLGGFLVSYLFVTPPVAVALIIVIGGPFVVAIANASAYILKIKKVPW